MSDFNFPVTEEAVAKWMAECDAGLHPLSVEDEDALEKSKIRLVERLRQEAENRVIYFFAE